MEYTIRTVKTTVNYVDFTCAGKKIKDVTSIITEFRLQKNYSISIITTLSGESPGRDKLPSYNQPPYSKIYLRLFIEPEHCEDDFEELLGKLNDELGFSYDYAVFRDRASALAMHNNIYNFILKFASK